MQPASDPLARTARLALPALALALFLAMPWIADKGIVFIAGTVALQIVFGLTWNLMFGQTGLVSFGHASFFAIGGYSYAYAARALPQLHPLLTFAGAGLVCAAIAALVGLVALRRSLGVYFAILTLALSQIVYLVISSSAALGREDGFTGIRRPKLPLGWTTVDLAAGNNYYYFLVLVCAGLAGVVWWVTHSRFGRVFRAIQQDPERAAFLGIPVQRYRLLSYATASGIAGIAGALFGPWLQILTPEVAHWTASARPILYTLLGGVHFFWGPAVGALGFAVLEYGTRTLHGISEIVTGAILLGVVLAAPGGILGAIGRLRQGRTARGAAP